MRKKQRRNEDIYEEKVIGSFIDLCRSAVVSGRLRLPVNQGRETMPVPVKRYIMWESASWFSMTPWMLPPRGSRQR